MKRNQYAIPLRGMLVAVLILAFVAVLSQARSGLEQKAKLADPAVSAPGVLTGSYTGAVALQGSYPGDLNAVATPVALDLGSIDLALDLSQTGNSIAGYVALDNTLVFTREHTIMVTPVGPTPGPGTPAPTPHPLDIGPQVQGTFDGATVQLQSEQFSTMLNGRQVKRQFSLKSTSVQANGATILGEYRETLWDYAPEPSTVVGVFSIQRPVFSHSVYLPLLWK